MSLPPLTAIRAFEAVARHLSFTRAAAELGMTQAAVSYQIRLLEERLGAPLFLRQPRQIALSALGRRLAPDVTAAFDTLRNAFARTQQQADGELAITCVPTFASYWLAANIGLFQLSHPGIAVRVEASTQLVDFTREPFDAGIRAAPAVPEGMVGHELVRAEFAPMLSPGLVEALDIREPADLLRVPMVAPQDHWVPAWLALAGVAVDQAPIPSSAYLGSQDLEAAAAIAGRGFAMLTPPFYADELASGRLVQPFEPVGWDGYCYYLIYPESRRNLPKIRALRDWLLAATQPLRNREKTR